VILASVILVLGIAIAVSIPERYLCPDGTILKSQLRSATGERIFFCESAPVAGLPVGGLPSNARLDQRVPLRIAVAAMALVLAVGLVALVLRKPTIKPVDEPEDSST
jgi:hypothetical protein